MARVLAIVPCFNEAGSLPSLLPEIFRTAPDWDILVVDDGSTDNTAEVASAFGVQVARLPINLGIGGAVQTGFKFAAAKGYDVCLQIDGDGQHDPAKSLELVEHLRISQVDVVSGSRFIEKEGFQSTRLRRAGIRLLSATLTVLTGKGFSDPTSGQRAFGARAIDLFSRYYPQEYPEPEAICLARMHGLSVAESPVRMRSRETGRSSIRRLQSALYMLKVILAMILVVSRPPKLFGSE
ncbi:MAG: glycosyl transferase family 2 [Deltaproteobacteria bacterium]|nr:glycosyl transferase family 2 [Deltaproteobacteria bacterium]